MDRKKMYKNTDLMLSFIGMTMVLVLGGIAGVAQATDGAILPKFSTITTVASTVPANGDVNPYGVAEVKHSVGNLKEGHILVSNFNNSSNLQGTGWTIVDVAPDGTVNLFAQIDPDTLPGMCPGGVGLTTALVVLRSGWVIVGSLPTTDGTAATAQAGCLIVLDSTGNPVETIFGSLINGPWDMVASEDEQDRWPPKVDEGEKGGNYSHERGHSHEAKLFVTNVLNGTVEANGEIVNQGTVVRINLNIQKDNMPWIESMTVVGSGFPTRTDPAALVIGPTGVGINPDEDHPSRAFRRKIERHVLYVADSLSNRIAVIPDALNRTTWAGIGFTLSSGGSLNDPLGLVVAPNGHILTVNGNDGFITEITPDGLQIAEKLLDDTGGPPPGVGTLFGLVFDPARGIYFVDNGTNTLNLLH